MRKYKTIAGRPVSNAAPRAGKAETPSEYRADAAPDDAFKLLDDGLAFFGFVAIAILGILFLGLA